MTVVPGPSGESPERGSMCTSPPWACTMPETIAGRARSSRGAVARPVSPVEALERALCGFRIDARAVIDHGETGAVVDHIQRDLDRRALGRVGRRVVDEVRHYLMKLIGIAEDGYG